MQDISYLQSADPNKMLRELAEEQKFKIEYLDPTLISSSSGSSQEYHSIVALSFDTMILFMGKGTSKSQSKKCASECALQCLNAMLQS